MRRKMDRRKSKQQLMGESCKVRRTVATEIFQTPADDTEKAGREARRDLVCGNCWV
jgi:formate-dependent nitrite reductase cytochrome c552 subunit